MQLLDLTRPDVFENLALDDALLDAAEASGGPGVLRFWELGTMAVVLGASGRLAPEVHREACRADGVPVARRSSGGGTVVIGPGSLCVSLVLPIGASPDYQFVDRAQTAVLGRTAGALAGLDPRVQLLGSGDLTIDGRKFSGSAQRRLRRCFLVHFTVLHRFPLERIARYLAAPGRQPDYRAGRPHEAFVTNLDRPREAIQAAIRAAWLPPGGATGAPEIPWSRARELVQGKLGRRDWIERL